MDRTGCGLVSRYEVPHVPIIPKAVLEAIEREQVPALAPLGARDHEVSVALHRCEKELAPEHVSDPAGRHLPLILLPVPPAELLRDLLHANRDDRCLPEIAHDFKDFPFDAPEPLAL